MHGSFFGIIWIAHTWSVIAKITVNFIPAKGKKDEINKIAGLSADQIVGLKRITEIGDFDLFSAPTFAGPGSQPSKQFLSFSIFFSFNEQ